MSESRLVDYCEEFHTHESLPMQVRECLKMGVGFGLGLSVTLFVTVLSTFPSLDKARLSFVWLVPGFAIFSGVSIILFFIALLGAARQGRAKRPSSVEIGQGKISAFGNGSSEIPLDRSAFWTGGRVEAISEAGLCGVRRCVVVTDGQRIIVFGVTEESYQEARRALADAGCRSITGLPPLSAVFASSILTMFLIKFVGYSGGISPSLTVFLVANAAWIPWLVVFMSHRIRIKKACVVASDNNTR